MSDWYVEIRPYTEDENLVTRMGPMTEREAKKVDRGANINLNHEKYYTRIVRPAAENERIPH